jgi:hypothetical protein
MTVRACCSAGAPFELVVSELRRPPVRPGTLRRSLLIERLARGDPRPIVSVVAPGRLREDHTAVGSRIVP